MSWTWVPCSRRALRNPIPAVPVLVSSRSRLSICRLTLALLIVGSWGGSFDEKVNGQVVTFGPVVRIVYLVPSDRVSRNDYKRHLDGAISHLQIWLRNELGENLSFSIDKKPVEVLQTSHTAAWYRENPVGPFAVWFFNNVVADGFAVTGGQFNDSSNIWVFYIDAEPACGQLTGATSGVAVLPEHDLRGLAGEENIPTCPTDPVDTAGVCRWVGGLGHELGHALGLPHPLACEDGDPSTECPSDNLMWLGYITYPDTYLLESDKTFLENSSFISPVHIRKSLPACTLK